MFKIDTRMHFESKTLYFIILYNLVLSQKSNVQDDIYMCEFDDGIKLKREYSSIKLENKDVISWFLCKDNSRKPPCPQNSLICLNEVVNLGSSFKLIKDEHFYHKYCLQSQNGDVCKSDPTRRYVVNITFHAYSIKPTLLPSGGDCEFHIAVPDPTAEYPCTKRVKGHLLDFRPLMEDFSVIDGDDTYKFNLCGTADGCHGDQVSSCVVGLEYRSLGDSSRRMINYEENSGLVWFQFKDGPFTTKVELNCNWNVLFGTPSYLKSVSSPKIKKFALDSSLGCVKLPMDCKFSDSYYEYDLSDLYRNNSNWEVSNDQNRKIEINICGPLQNSRGICEGEHSQVCETVGQDSFVSYGSFFVDKDVERDNVKARLISKSVCPKNDSLTTTTGLTFKCSFEEKGPKLISSTDCSLDILWETPRACPTQVRVQQDLIMKDYLGQRNLRALCDKGDRTYHVNGSYYITYNLCKPLKRPCNGAMSVSACLNVNGKEEILGYYKEAKLISTNGLLSMELFGAPCKKLSISFACDYAETDQGLVNLEIKHDNCVYKMDIKTPAACIGKPNQQSEKRCFVRSGPLFYDFTDLALTSSNYKFTAGNENIEYVINICSPIVTESGALCKGNTNICMYNKTEPNVKHRFFSIGAQYNLPKVEGDHITIEFESGDWCPNNKYASGSIHFKCSNTEIGPKFLRESDCFYEFSWQTPHACPKVVTAPMLQCLVPFQNDFLDLETVESREFSILYKDGSNFLFNICSDNYTRIYKDGRNETVVARRQAHEKNITFQLGNTCNKENVDSWNKVSIIFSCEDGAATFEFVTVRDCSAYVKCNTKSKKFCPQVDRTVEGMVNDILKMAVEKISQFGEVVKSSGTSERNSPAKTEKHTQIKESQPRTSTKPPTKIILHTCTIAFGEEVINLNQLPPISLVSHSGSRYSIGLGNSSQCSGFICKNTLTMASLDDCPKALTQDSGLKVVFNRTRSPVGPFVAEITFKCNLTMEYPRIGSENKNALAVIYPMDRICQRPPSNGGIIAGIVILVIIIVAILSFATYRWCKRRHWILGRVEDKSNLYLYTRNSMD